MKSRIFGWVILLICCFAVAAASAEKTEDQLFLIVEFAVNPLAASEYEKVQKAFKAEAEKHKYAFPYTAYSTDDFH